MYIYIDTTLLHTHIYLPLGTFSEVIVMEFIFNN